MTAPYDGITRADVEGLGIPTGDGEELPQPAMTMAVSPEGDQVLVTTKHFRADLQRIGWTDADASTTTTDTTTPARPRRVTPS